MRGAVHTRWRYARFVAILHVALPTVHLVPFRAAVLDDTKESCATRIAEWMSSDGLLFASFPERAADDLG